MSEIEKIKNQFFSKLEEAKDLEKVNQIKSELFGKNGIISNQFKVLATKSDEDKKTFASELNTLKNDLQTIINKKVEKIKIEEIKSLIKKSMPDAEIIIKDLAGDENHYSATIKSKIFSGKSKIEQHKLVYKALKGKMGNELHALALNTMEN